MDPLTIISWNLSSAGINGQRENLVRFWLASPDDLVETLWQGIAGQVTREMVAELTNTTFLPEPLISLRNNLGHFLQSGFHQPGAVKAVITTFLLSPPGQFRIVNPESHLPMWLVPSYRSLYEQGLPQQISSGPDSQHLSSQQPSNASPKLPSPSFGDSAASLSEFAANRLQLNKLLGLSNLYYIDPDDLEIKEELLQMRRQVASLIFAADESAFESLFATDFADRYWALVRSGIQHVDLNDDDNALKTKAKTMLNPAEGGGFEKPGAIAAILVAMIYYVPGTMQVNDAQAKLPAWLFPGYNQLFAAALQS